MEATAEGDWLDLGQSAYVAPRHLIDIGDYGH
jgi:hypothetical protein